MQHARVFMATSLAQVIRQLLIYQPSGVLTIRRMGNGPQEEVSLVIEDGHPVRFRWGSVEDHFDESMLRYINSWGAIQFTFQGHDAVRQLPAPNQPGRPDRSTRPLQPRSPLVTRPLPAISTFTQPTYPSGENGNGYRKQNGYEHPEARHKGMPQQPGAGSALSPLSQTPPTPPHATTHSRKAPAPITPPTFSPETIIPVLTAAGREFPVNNLPRYDRTVFLLINGQRSVADLMHLTRRPLSEVYSSLYRLRAQQLIAGDI